MKTRSKMTKIKVEQQADTPSNSDTENSQDSMLISGTAIVANNPPPIILGSSSGKKKRNPVVSFYLLFLSLSDKIINSIPVGF